MDLTSSKASTHNNTTVAGSSYLQKWFDSLMKEKKKRSKSPLESLCQTAGAGMDLFRQLSEEDNTTANYRICCKRYMCIIHFFFTPSLSLSYPGVFTH